MESQLFNDAFFSTHTNTHIRSHQLILGNLFKSELARIPGEFGSQVTLVTIHFITYLFLSVFIAMQNETKRFSIGVDLMAERFEAFKFQEHP